MYINISNVPQPVIEALVRLLVVSLHESHSTNLPGLDNLLDQKMAELFPAIHDLEPEYIEQLHTLCKSISSPY